jgi:hypothetical protein
MASMIVPLSPQASIVSRVISKRRRRKQPAVGLESQRHPLGPHLSRPQEINLNTVSAGQADGEGPLGSERLDPE